MTLSARMQTLITIAETGVLPLFYSDDAERAGTIAARICFMHARRAYLQARELFGNLVGGADNEVEAVEVAP